MENYIYKKDYTNISKASNLNKRKITKEEIFPTLKLYDKLYKRLNHIILPHAQENFDSLISKLDSYTKYYRGTIEGVIDYTDFGALVIVTLPFFEFTDSKQFELLKYITDTAESITFSLEQGKIQLDITIPYFQCIMPEDPSELEMVEAEIVKEIQNEL